MAALFLRAAGPADVTNSPSATREPFATPRPAKAANGVGHEFPRASRILRSAEFRAVYENGTRIPGPLFTAFILVRNEPEREFARIGLTVPRAIGNAVVRNRIKRRIREAFRLHRSEFAPCDIVINPRSAAADAPFPQLERALLKVMEKCKR